MSLFHRHSRDEAPKPTVPEPPAAPAPAAPPSPDELEALHELRLLKDQLEDGKLTQAEYDARRQRPET